MEGWRLELAARFRARDAAVAPLAEVVEEYGRLSTAVREEHAGRLALERDNKLMRFELVKADVGRLRELEEENAVLRRRLRDRERLNRSLPAGLGAGDDPAHDSLLRELRAANEQNAHLRTLLHQARADRRASE